MGIIFNEASFKNSRVAARAPTTQANTFQQTIALGPANTLIAPFTANRTYITIRSTAATAGDDIRYDYFDNPAILTEGFLLKAGEACDLESPQAIYAQAVVNAVLCTIDEGQG
jgi:hypothetical protein